MDRNAPREHLIRILDENDPEGGVTNPDEVEDFWEKQADAILGAGFVEPHRVWFPMGDTPVVLQVSREQLQIVTDVLRGELATSRPGWRGYLADELDKVLSESLNDEG